MNQIKDRFSRVQVSHISDALGRTGVMRGIRPMFKQAVLFGPAFTVRVQPGDNLALHRALNEASPGEVLVVDGGSLSDIALWGELMSSMPRRGESQVW